MAINEQSERKMIKKKKSVVASVKKTVKKTDRKHSRQLTDSEFITWRREENEELNKSCDPSLWGY